MALRINADGTTNEVSPKAGKEFSLKELQDVVGGYIEVVPWTALMGERMMLANEEGRFQSLPVNASASAIACRKIVGDVIMVDGVEFN